MREFVTSNDLGGEVPELGDVDQEVLCEREDLTAGGHELVRLQQLLGDLEKRKSYFEL